MKVTAFNWCTKKIHLLLALQFPSILLQFISLQSISTPVSLYCTFFNSISLYFNPFYNTSTPFHLPSLRYLSPPTFLHFTLTVNIHFILLHFTSLYTNSFHLTSLHFTVLSTHFTPFSLYILHSTLSANNSTMNYIARSIKKFKKLD